MIARYAFAAAAVAAILTTPAEANDPAVPLGEDPGGTAIAVIGTGVDYTHPAVAVHLARDGEGEIVAWDFTDGDDRPFQGDHSAFGNLMAELLVQTEFRLIPIRVDSRDPNWLASGASFAARTPAAAVLLPIADIPAEIARIKPVAEAFPNVQFVAVAQSGAVQNVKAAIAGLANAGLLAEGMCTGMGGARAAVELIGGRLCWPSETADGQGFRFAE